VALSRATGDPYTLGLALINLGFLHNDQGDIARAQPLFEEGLAWGRQARHPVIIARAQRARRAGADAGCLSPGRHLL
jgi:hypothetical protein